jgi:hypothetical protein
MYHHLAADPVDLPGAEQELPRGDPSTKPR